MGWGGGRLGGSASPQTRISGFLPLLPSGRELKRYIAVKAKMQITAWAYSVLASNCSIIISVTVVTVVTCYTCCLWPFSAYVFVLPIGNLYVEMSTKCVRLTCFV